MCTIILMVADAQSEQEFTTDDTQESANVAKQQPGRVRQKNEARGFTKSLSEYRGAAAHRRFVATPPCTHSMTLLLRFFHKTL